MTINPNTKLPSLNDSDFYQDDSFGDFDNDMADFVIDSTQGKSSKQSSKRNYQTKKKLERLKDERRARKYDDDDYDDWG